MKLARMMSCMDSKIPTLQEVDAYPVPDLLIPRVARVNNIPEEFAAGLVKEAKRMLYLCVAADMTIAPSDRVDWAWHEMLMFTRFYRSFADFIGGFIHHDPNPPTDDDMHKETWEEIQKTLGMPRRGTDTYNATKAGYEKQFGEKPNPLYWP